MTKLQTVRQDPWSLFDDLLALRGGFDRVFDLDRPLFTGGFPPMNVWSSEEDLIVDAELPGVDPKAVELSVLGNQLTVSGTRKARPEDGDRHYHRAERDTGDFTRTVELPFRVDAGQVTATYRHGILRVTLPRAAEDKPRKVAIKAA